MEKVFGRPIITQEEMKRRVKELGIQITRDYQGKDLLVIGVLKGAFAFSSDLIRAIHLPVRVDFMVVSSRSSTQKGGKVKVVSDLTEEIEGQDVLLVEDIVDSGMTLNTLKKRLNAQRPNSLKVCVLLDKPDRRKVQTVIDYVGFTIPNKFVVGYGLDYRNKYRNLPYIAVLDNVDEKELFYWQGG